MGVSMSGHSKWSSIKRKKKMKDNRRGKLFSKLTNEIKVLSKDGTDIKKNFKLKNAILRALNKNVTKTTIQNIIDKETTCKNKNLYALSLPNNSIFILECLESNNKKIISDLRCLLLEFSGNLIPCSNIINLFMNVIRINLSNNYNEEYIIYKLSNEYIYEFIDHSILVKSCFSHNIISKLKSMNLNITYASEFITKKNIHINDNCFQKLSELKKKIMKKINISNIFTNVSGL